MTHLPTLGGTFVYFSCHHFSVRLSCNIINGYDYPRGSDEKPFKSIFSPVLGNMQFNCYMLNVAHVII